MVVIVQLEQEWDSVSKMPKYRFVCDKCGKGGHKYVPTSVTELSCKDCDGKMHREMPKLASGTEVKETVDQYTGVTWNQDQKSLTKERHEQHFWEVEVPRLIQTYSLETCIENKWLVYNEKGELVINKPPSKR
jgi:hypothetical protein